jgi:hypothetical protein
MKMLLIEKILRLPLFQIRVDVSWAVKKKYFGKIIFSEMFNEQQKII